MKKVFAIYGIDKLKMSTTEVIIGVDGEYINGDYTLKWLYGNNYLNDKGYSGIEIYKNGICVGNGVICDNKDLKMARKTLKEYGFELSYY